MLLYTLFVLHLSSCKQVEYKAYSFFIAGHTYGQVGRRIFIITNMIILRLWEVEWAMEMEIIMSF